jgi:hypothetical protein
MFAFDRYYKNPWNSIFISSINIILRHIKHKFNEVVLNKAKYLVENQFLYIWHYKQMTMQPENRSMDRTKEEKELLDEYGIILKENSEHEGIVANIKYKTWDLPEIIQWNVYT